MRAFCSTTKSNEAVCNEHLGTGGWISVCEKQHQQKHQIVGTRPRSDRKCLQTATTSILYYFTYTYISTCITKGATYEFMR